MTGFGKAIAQAIATVLAIAVGLAVLTLLATFLAEGTSFGSGQIIQLILAGLGAVGVIALPAPQYPAGPVARPRPAGPTEV